jgi:hypothetical protein
MTAVAERPTSSAMGETHPPDWQQESKLTLAALPSAINCARMLVSSTLRGWHLDKRCVKAIELATDELVVHAVATTGVTEALPLFNPAFDHLAQISITLRLTPQRAQIEVRDSGRTPPAPQLGQSRAIATSQDWGYDLPFPGKRVVWCTVPTLPQEDRDGTSGLPRRTPRPIPRRPVGGPVNAMRDPNLLRRVLDGLRGLDRTTEQEDPC